MCHCYAEPYFMLNTNNFNWNNNDHSYYIKPRHSKYKNIKCFSFNCIFYAIKQLIKNFASYAYKFVQPF